MIPILYESHETEFLSNGIGRMSDATSCVVTEEKNGMYELQMSYPIIGTLFKSIAPGALIKAINGKSGNKQIFEIYKISKPLNGIITICAEHISYRLSKVVVSPYTASNVADALGGLGEHASTDCPFTFWTDKVTNGDFAVDIPASIRSKLGGSEGSILDLYGGEYEFDNYMVRLWNKRGQDKGVELRYGKNITDITQEENIQNTITGVYPYWTGSDNAYYELPNKVVLSENASRFPTPRIVPLDCSSEFETKPTASELTKYASEYLSNNKAGIPEVNISVSFVNLAQTEEYKEVAQLEEVGMCDTVTVHFEKLDISARAEVVKTSYNVLKEKYDSVQVGEVKANLASNIVNQNAIIKEKPSRNFLEQAIQNATNLITGVDGGYVVLHQDGNGKPYEILIMDTEDIETATNVWRWNKNGWGHSSNGYNGPYTMAATLDGGFVADFITTGTMLANRIKGGTLTLGGKDNGDGVASVLNASGNEVVRLSKDGMECSNAYITGGDINIEAPYRQAKIGIRFGENETIIYPTSIVINGSNGDWVFLSGGYLVLDSSSKRVLIANDNTFNIGSDSVKISGSLSVSGTKSRIAKTKSYYNRLLYCYEMPSPIFGDVGHGIIGEDGLCYVDIDQVFFETIDTEQSYQVFLQSYSEHNVYVSEKQQGYFVVKGEPNTEFDWEMKAKQLDFPIERLEEQLAEDDYEETDYVATASEYLSKYEQEVLNYG